MLSLCDANVLLALCHADHVHHGAAMRWLDAVDRRAAVVVCRISQLTLLRLLNTPAVMLGRPRTVRECWRDYDTLMSDERIAFAREPNGIERAVRSLMPGSLVSPKLWQDAYLAAFAVASGFALVTFDAAFRQFREVDLVLLS